MKLKVRADDNTDKSTFFKVFFLSFVRINVNFIHSQSHPLDILVNKTLSVRFCK